VYYVRLPLTLRSYCFKFLPRPFNQVGHPSISNDELAEMQHGWARAMNHVCCRLRGQAGLGAEQVHRRTTDLRNRVGSVRP
jgi:hypothetical protein